MCRIDAQIIACTGDKQLVDVRHADETVKSYTLTEMQQLEKKQKLQWVPPAEAVAQSLDGMLK